MIAPVNNDIIATIPIESVPRDLKSIINCLRNTLPLSGRLNAWKISHTYSPMSYINFIIEAKLVKRKQYSDNSDFKNSFSLTSQFLDCIDLSIHIQALNCFMHGSCPGFRVLCEQAKYLSLQKKEKEKVQLSGMESSNKTG